MTTISNERGSIELIDLDGVTAAQNLALAEAATALVGARGLAPVGRAILGAEIVELLGRAADGETGSVRPDAAFADDPAAPIARDGDQRLAEAIGAFLLREGGIRSGAALSGPHLLQFLDESTTHGRPSPLLGRTAKTVGLVVNAPAVFARPDFIEWLADSQNRILTYHPKHSFHPDEYSDTVVLVDANYEGDSSDMPEDIWHAICDAAYAVYGGPDAPRSLDHHVHVRLTNLAE